MKNILILLMIFTFLSINILAQSDLIEQKLAGSAYLDNVSYEFLRKICDNAGGRPAGTANNIKAMQILVDELQKLGMNARYEKFNMPGWFRADDEIEVTVPTSRKLHTVPLAYTQALPAFESNAVYASSGYDEDYKNLDVKGKIVIVEQEHPSGKEQMLRYEALDIAVSKGAAAILFINDKPGFQLLIGVGNFQGNINKIPAFSITQEEGKWLKRILDNGEEVKLKITVNSINKGIESSNIVFTLPGKVSKKIVIGAHFDSWDLGQGSVDNGVGTAVLFETARLMKQINPDNYYTLEFVWFNGEELGLWGSKRYNEMHKDDDIAAMINMDMIGMPTGINAMGFDDFIPFFKDLVKKLNGFNMKDGVVSAPGTNSDHMYFLFNGIPVFSFNAFLDEPSYHWYHDTGDTFDKVNKKYLSDAAAVVSITIKELSNKTDLPFKRMPKEEVKNMLIKNNLEKRLRKQKEWIFDK